MMHVVCDANIPLISELFSHPPFNLTLVPTLTNSVIKQADALICRSTTQVNKALLHNTSVKYILTATSGIDHIDLHYLSSKKIIFFDAKGSNAQSVCDYVLSLIAERDHLLNGRRVGIVGVGEVGQRVASQLLDMGFDVNLCDPYRALKEPDFKHVPLDQIIDCDIISLHVPYSTSGEFPTYLMIADTFLKQLKPNTLLINTARGGIIDEDELLALPNKIKLCLDVFQNEPKPNKALLSLCDSATPHIAGHAFEAKFRASLKIYRKLCNELNVPYEKTRYDHILQEKNIERSLNCYKGYYSTQDETEILKKMTRKHDFVNLRRAHSRHEYTQNP